MDTRQILMMILFAIAGGGVGWAYFAIMSRSIENMIGGKRDWSGFAAFGLLRVALFLAGVLLAIKLDTWYLVPYMLMFLVARTLVVRRARNAGMLPPPTSQTETE